MLSAFWACLWSWDGWDKGMHRSSHQFRNNPYNHGCRVTDQNLPILTCKLNKDQFGRIHPKHPKAAKNLPLLWSDDVVVYWRKLPAREQLHVAWYPAFLPKAWHHKSVELDNRIIVVIDCWPSMLLMLGLSNPNTAGISLAKSQWCHTRLGDIGWKWLFSTKQLQTLIHRVYYIYVCVSL